MQCTARQHAATHCTTVKHKRTRAPESANIRLCFASQHTYREKSVVLEEGTEKEEEEKGKEEKEEENDENDEEEENEEEDAEEDDVEEKERKTK